MMQNHRRSSSFLKSTVILTLFTCCLCTLAEAARVLDRNVGGDSFHGEIATSTPEPPPASNIEDPANSAATSDGGGEEDVCFRCYDVVKMAQDLINIQNDLVKKQRKLIKQKNKAEAAATAASGSPTSSADGSTSMRKPLNRQRQRGENSTIPQSGQTAAYPSTRIRSLENQPIVVSRLRVARSAQSNGDSALEKLKSKQEQQLNKTCKTLHEVHHCLNGIKRECVGDLQYHTQEVYKDQWLDKLNCPYINNPNIKPWKGLTRSVPNIQEQEKVPVPRPISSPEEVQKRLDAILGGGRNRNPIGVMLKPTLTMSASQKFNSLSETSGQQQLPMLNGLAGGYPTKGRHLLSSNQVMANIDGQYPPESQLLAMTSQLLLVPAFLILVVLFVALASRYIKQTRE